MYGFDSTRFKVEVLARELLTELEIEKPNDLMWVLNELDIKYFETSLDEGVDGALLCADDNYGILINENIRYASRKRFTIAHELGHYWIPEHFGNFNCTSVSIGSFDLKSNYEMQADIFAAEFLMPTPLFVEDIKYKSPSIGNFELLADKYGTSLTATSIKFIKNDETPGMLVYAADSKVKWSINSKNNYWNLNYKNDSNIVQRMYSSGQNVVDDTMDSYYWFDDFKYDNVNISVRNFKNLNAQLIYISLPVDDSIYDYEEEDEY